MANEVFGWGHKKVNLQLRTREKLLKDSNRSTRQKVREEPHGTEFNILLILMVLVKRMTITCNKMQTLVFYVAKWCRQWCISTPGVAEFQGDVRCQQLFIFIVGLTISNTFGCQPCAASTHTQRNVCSNQQYMKKEEGFIISSRLTWVWYVVPVRSVKLIVGLEDLLKQLGIVLIVEGWVTTEPAETKSADYKPSSLYVFINQLMADSLTQI